MSVTWADWPARTWAPWPDEAGQARWKFFDWTDGRIMSQTGHIAWRPGEWVVHEGRVEPGNESGLYSAPSVVMAMIFAPGAVDVLGCCEPGGEFLADRMHQGVHGRLRIVRAWRWRKNDNVAVAFRAAVRVLPSYESRRDGAGPREAIEAVVEYGRAPAKASRAAALARARALIGEDDGDAAGCAALAAALAAVAASAPDPWDAAHAARLAVVHAGVAADWEAAGDAGAGRDLPDVVGSAGGSLELFLDLEGFIQAERLPALPVIYAGEEAMSGSG